MSEQTTGRQREERAAAATTAVWHYSGPFGDPFDAVNLLNNPFPLPPGTVSVAADNNGFHVFWLE